MHKKTTQLRIKISKGREVSVPVFHAHTIVLGSGAAGLNAAAQLDASGIKELIVVSEGLGKGTSINTGSDKQTYYKLGMYGENNDSPALLAKSFFDGGGMHGDLALVEASLSPRAFFNLVNLGVAFPRDRYGQFIGYKTDHDPFRRATSVGPYTSREMCRALIAEIRRRRIEVRENRTAVSLLTVPEKKGRRAAGLIAIKGKTHRKGAGIESCIEIYLAENIVFATGGPGGLYRTSVYPEVHTGGIGLALLEGAAAQSLPESQYGLASIKFRWNVSGTYMQAIPKFISTAADGVSDPKEFLRPYFSSPGEMNSLVFLKGYQWPFDPRKAAGGSSIIDILTYVETVLKGRRVFLDFRSNPEGLDFGKLSKEAREYLGKSGALFGKPIDRLRKMNQPAISLYSDHGIDIAREMLEIAVCAQHNNGGLAGNHWWESINIKHLFPVGEVNGSHGVYRPGGSALNSGQVAGFRAAEFISNRYMDRTLDIQKALRIAETRTSFLLSWLEKGGKSGTNWKTARTEFQERMSRAGAHIRSLETIRKAVPEAWRQWKNIMENGIETKSLEDSIEALRNIQLCFAHAVYLEAIRRSIIDQVGSRGSALTLDTTNGTRIHPRLDDKWKYLPENKDFRDKVLETVASSDGKARNSWIPRRELPEEDAWFETLWADFRGGRIYR